MNHWFLSSVAAATLLLTGCGDMPADSAPGPAPANSRSDQSSGEIDPCKLTTAEEIVAVVGGSVGTGKNEMAAGVVELCRFKVGGGHLGDGDITVQHTAASDTDQAGYAKQKQTATQIGTVIDVSGVGDEAFFLSGANYLSLRKGRTVIHVVVLTKGATSAGDQLTADLTAIGRHVANRL